MNSKQLDKFQQEIRIGGRGTARRKKKVAHSNPCANEKRVQSTIKKLPLTTAKLVQEVIIIKDDGKVLYLKKPIIKASISANTMVIAGYAQDKYLFDILPRVIPYCDSHQRIILRDLVNDLLEKKAPGLINCTDADFDDDIPDLVESFEQMVLDNTSSSFEAAPTNPTEN